MKRRIGIVTVALLLVTVCSSTANAFTNRGEWVHTKEYGALYPVHQGLAAFSNENGKYGFINEQGEVVLAPQWNAVSDFYDDGVAIVYTGGIDVTGGAGNGVYQLIDTSGTVVSSEYAWISEVCSGFAAVKGKDGKFGIINAAGDVIADTEWDWTNVFGDDLFRVQLDNEYAYMNQQGEVISDFSSNYTGNYSEGRAPYIGENGLTGFLDENQSIVIDCTWKEVTPFEEGLTRVLSTDGSYGFIDKNGEIVSEPTWKEAVPFFEEYTFVQDQELYTHLIDHFGNVLDSDLSFCGIVNEHMVAAENWADGTCNLGYYDTEKKAFLPVDADSLKHYESGLGYFIKDGKTGAVDRDGTVAISAEWDELNYFEDGCTSTTAKKDGEWYLVDRRGQIVKHIDLGSEEYIADTQMDDQYLLLRQQVTDRVVGTWRVAYEIDSDGNSYIADPETDKFELVFLEDGSVLFRVGDVDLYGDWTIVEISQGQEKIPSMLSLQTAYSLRFDDIDGDYILTAVFIDYGDPDYNQLSIVLNENLKAYFIREESSVQNGDINNLTALSLEGETQDEETEEQAADLSEQVQLPTTIDDFENNLRIVIENNPDNVKLEPTEQSENDPNTYLCPIYIEDHLALIMFSTSEGDHYVMTYTGEATEDSERKYCMSALAYAVAAINPQLDVSEVKEKIAAEEMTDGKQQTDFGEIMVELYEDGVGGISY